MIDTFTMTAVLGIIASVVTYGAAFGVCSRAKRPRHRIVAEWMFAASAWLVVALYVVGRQAG